MIPSTMRSFTQIRLSDGQILDSNLDSNLIWIQIRRRGSTIALLPRNVSQELGAGTLMVMMKILCLWPHGPPAAHGASPAQISPPQTREHDVCRTRYMYFGYRRCMYYAHSTCMSYRDSICIYYGHSAYMYYGHSTCICYGHSTCMNRIQTTNLQENRKT